MPHAAQDPCQKQACDIQKCLQAMGYQESKCEHVIAEMLKCCDKFKEKSECCSGFLKGQRKKDTPQEHI